MNSKRPNNVLLPPQYQTRFPIRHAEAMLTMTRTSRTRQLRQILIQTTTQNGTWTPKVHA